MGVSASPVFTPRWLTVTNSTFSHNSKGSSDLGGGISNEEETASIADSTFIDNGGSAGNEGTLTVTNSTFTDGIINGAALAVTNCIFLNGGIFDYSGTASFKNTLAASNGSPSKNCATINGGTIIDASHNISDDNSCGFAKTGSANNGDGVNPLLSAAGLANNGGPTETIALDSESPAIDAIPFADCTDQALQGSRYDLHQRIGFY